MCIHTPARLSTTFSIQAHNIANSIINPRLSDNLYFELSARICTSQVFNQPNPIGFQQKFAVLDGLSVPANLRLVIVPLIHPSDAPFLVRGHLPYQSLPIGRCPLSRGMLLHCGMLTANCRCDSQSLCHRKKLTIIRCSLQAKIQPLSDFRPV